MLEQAVHKGTCPIEGTQAWKGAGEIFEQSFGEEGVAGTHDELITTPIPGAPALLVKGEVEKIRN